MYVSCTLNGDGGWLIFAERLRGRAAVIWFGSGASSPRIFSRGFFIPARALTKSVKDRCDDLQFEHVLDLAPTYTWLGLHVSYVCVNNNRSLF